MADRFRDRAASPFSPSGSKRCVVVKSPLMPADAFGRHASPDLQKLCHSVALDGFIFKYPWSLTMPTPDKSLTEKVTRAFEEHGVFEQHTEARSIVRKLQPELLGPLMFPNTSSSDRLFVVTLFLVTFFVYDDIMERQGAEPELDHVVGLITGSAAATPHEPRSLLRLIGFLGAEFSRTMPIDWMARFKHGMADYIASLSEEQVLLRDVQIHRQPSLVEYLSWRFPNIGGDVITYLVEYAYNIDLPSSVASGPLVGEIKKAYNTIMICQNDYCSWICGKDNGKVNIVFSFANDIKMDAKYAGPVIVSIHDAAVRGLMDHCSLLLRDQAENPGIAKWIQGTKVAFGGFARFQEIAKRYKSAKKISTGLADPSEDALRL